MNNPTPTKKVWKALTYTRYICGRTHTHELEQFETEVEALRYAIHSQGSQIYDNGERTLVFVSHETAHRFSCGGYSDDSHRDTAGKMVYNIEPKTENA